MEELIEIVILLPVAVAIVAVWDHYFGWMGHWCDRDGCDRYGRCNFTCHRCGKARLYYCRGCSFHILGFLRTNGSAIMTCVRCLEKGSKKIGRNLA